MVSLYFSIHQVLVLCHNCIPEKKKMGANQKAENKNDIPIRSYGIG
jgi:hypothetical protein